MKGRIDCGVSRNTLGRFCSIHCTHCVYYTVNIMLCVKLKMGIAHIYTLYIFCVVYNTDNRTVNVHFTHAHMWRLQEGSSANFAQSIVHNNVTRQSNRGAAGSRGACGRGGGTELSGQPEWLSTCSKVLPPLYSSCYPQLPARLPSFLFSPNFPGDKTASFLDAQASLDSRTYPGELVRGLVGHTSRLCFSVSGPSYSVHEPWDGKQYIFWKLWPTSNSYYISSEKDQTLRHPKIPFGTFGKFGLWW